MSGVQVAGHAADRRHADAGLALHLAVGDLVLQLHGDRPAVGQRLQLGGRAQVAEEGPQLLGVRSVRIGLVERAAR